MIRNGLPVTSHSIAQLSISSGIFEISSGSCAHGIVLATFGNGASKSDQVNPCRRASDFARGYFVIFIVWLYPKWLYFAGKNSPHSPVFTMCSMIFGTSSSYSSLLYCLFKMQYEASRSPTHQKQLWTLPTQ